MGPNENKGRCKENKASRLPRMAPSSMATVLFLGAIFVQLSQCIKFSVGIEHDMSGPTYGLEGKTSSQINYDDRNGLKLGGTVNEIFGPPLKIANGLGNVFKGSNMAGIGSGLRGGGALLGLDAKLLETAGAGNLMKGGLLLNGAEWKANAAGQVAGPKGRKIASIIELPVKVVAMKDLAAGQALTAAGQLKGAAAQAADSKGQQMMAQGHALKSQGISQIVQGANEGVQNIGNMAQKTSDNVNSAFKLFPLVWDMHQQEYAANHEAALKGQQQQQQQQLVSTPHQLGGGQSSSGLTGGSLFGGLSTLFNPNAGSLLSGSNYQPNNGYAAMWNATSPFTNLLMNPAANPFLLPMSGSPLAQAIQAKQPIGTHESAADPNSQGASFDFNLFPGLRYSEHISSSPSSFNKFGHKKQVSTTKTHAPIQQSQAPIEQQQQQQVLIPQQQEQQQPVQEKKP